MKQVIYSVCICLSTDGKKAKWSNCGCPAGIEGKCKHVIASLYGIQNFILLGEDQFPDREGPTERRQVWHIRKPVQKSNCVLYKDITIEKVDPGKVKSQFGGKIYNYLGKVNVSKTVTQDNLMKCASALEILDLPIISTWKSCDYQPVQKKVVDMNCPISEIIFKNMASIDTKFQHSYSPDSEDSKSFYNTVIKISFDESKALEESTRTQSNSPMWKRCRYYRITASNFKTFCNLRATTNPITTHKQIHRTRISTAAEHHGKFYEPVALKKLLDSPNLDKYSSHAPVGLIVHPLLPHLGASPDHAILLADQTTVVLVEIKCPYSLFMNKKSILEASASPGFHLRIDNNNVLHVNEKTATYYQIQAQLCISNSPKAVLCVFVPPSDLVLIYVERNPEFFLDCLTKLNALWFEQLLPSFSSDA